MPWTPTVALTSPGLTFSTDFPITAGAFQPSLAGREAKADDFCYQDQSRRGRGIALSGNERKDPSALVPAPDVTSSTRIMFSFGLTGLKDSWDGVRDAQGELGKARTLGTRFAWAAQSPATQRQRGFANLSLRER